MKYIANSFIITDTPDNYKNGECGGSDVFEINALFEANTISELINKIGNEYLDSTGVDNFMSCAVVFDDSVSLSGMVDKNGTACISAIEWDDWKNLKIDLLAREIRFDIAVKLSHDELVAAGIESYD